MVAGPRVLTDGRPALPPSVVPRPPVGHLRVRADRAAAAGVRSLLGHLAPRCRGRESFFTPPHLVLYAGFGYVALPGIVESVSGAIAPRWAGPRIRIVGLLVPVEFLLIGTGALFQAVAFPWDEAWHRLVAEGLVSPAFRSPPHVMAIAGGIVSTFGFFLAVVLERTRW